MEDVGGDRWVSVSMVEMLAHLFVFGAVCEYCRAFLMKACKHFTTLSGIWSSLLLQETGFAY